MRIDARKACNRRFVIDLLVEAAATAEFEHLATCQWHHQRAALHDPPLAARHGNDARHHMPVSRLLEPIARLVKSGRGPAYRNPRQMEYNYAQCKAKACTDIGKK